jgi:hypothetical protein
VAALAEAAELVLAPACAHRAGDAAQLLVARHAALAGEGVAGVDRRGRRECPEAQVEAVALALHRDGPLAQRLAHAHPQPGERDRLPARAVADLEPAARDRGDRLAAREQDGQGAAPAIVAVLARREADPRQPVELRGGVAERERHRVRERWPGRLPGPLELRGAHRAGRRSAPSSPGGESTAVPSTSYG